MIHINKIKMVGSLDKNFKPLNPFNNLICDFLEDLSNQLKTEKSFEDIISLAFWLRKKNILKYKNKYSDSDERLGRGLIFHITPSNIPLNFAYSFVFGLLSGNANVIRCPSKNFPQIEIFCTAINKLFLKNKYREISKMNIFVKYEKNKKINDYFSSMCNGRIIWGGDNTINEIRESKISPQSTDITFADRYSFSIINASEFNKLDDNKINIIVKNFYNDTYYVDQNACSSPHLIIWSGKNLNKAKKIFWKKLELYIEKKFSFNESAIVDKYSDLLSNAINFNYFDKKEISNNKMYRVSLSKLTNLNHNLRGKWGLFYEYDSKNLDNLKKIINYKYQTLTYFGLDKIFLRNFVIHNRLKGIDRIVPIGKALDIDLIWDGYDIINSLSRKINLY